jgi:uncharacterized protein
MVLLPEDSWEVKDVAGKGRGLFAKKDIPPGTIIGDYLGKIIRPEDEEQYDNDDHFYLMYYHDTASVYPDLSTPGIHLLNHSCAPNTWMYTYYGHTLYFAIRKIFAGEELTVSYLLSPQDKDCNPCTHLCSCNSVICFTTMHLSDERYKAWEKVHDEQAEKTPREEVTYDQMLKPLASYPDSLPDHPIYTLYGSREKEVAILEETALPSLQEIRTAIRETGKTLAFPKMNLHIHGVLDTTLISEVLT